MSLSVGVGLVRSRTTVSPRFRALLLSPSICLCLSLLFICLSPHHWVAEGQIQPTNKLRPSPLLVFGYIALGQRYFFLNVQSTYLSKTYGGINPALMFYTISLVKTSPKWHILCSLFWSSFSDKPQFEGGKNVYSYVAVSHTAAVKKVLLCII